MLSGICYPKKKIETTEKKQDPALNPPRQYSIKMKTLGVSSIIKCLAQVDIQRDLLPDKILL